MNIQQINDKAYKYLFSNHRIFHQLLKYFVHEDFEKDIKPEDLEQVSQEFISGEFLKRESDIIYRVKNRNLYIFVLMELQSTPQPRFPLRMLNYICQFYETQSRKRRTQELLPNVFPLLLYNGKTDWKIPLSAQELLRNDLPRKYIPRLTYYPIIIKDIPNRVLDNIRSTVSAMMLLEKAGNEKAFKGLISRLMDVLSEESIINKEQLSHWANILFKPDQKVDFTTPNTLHLEKGEKPMLAELAQQIRNKAEAEGLEKGLQKGIEKGIEKGIKQGITTGREQGILFGMIQEKQIILKKLLTRKFHPSDKLLLQVDYSHDPQKLDDALDAILMAETAEKVLEFLK